MIPNSQYKIDNVGMLEERQVDTKMSESEIEDQEINVSESSLTDQLNFMKRAWREDRINTNGIKTLIGTSDLQFFSYFHRAILRNIK